VFGEFLVPLFAWRVLVLTVGIGCAGIFVSFFIAACHVQWDRFSSGRGLNHLMAVTTVFFGFATTAVSQKGPPPRNLNLGTYPVMYP